MKIIASMLILALIIWLYSKYSKPSIQAKIFQCLMRITRKLFLPGHKLITYSMKQCGKPMNYCIKPKDDYKVNTCKLNTGASVEILTSSSKKDDYVLYQLHGGAYIFPLENMHRKAAKYFKDNMNLDVASLNYRVIPNTHPAALNDAIAGYDLLCEQYDPKNIFVIGDSAGGNLALTMTLKLIQLKKQVPRAIVLMSPWGDLECSTSSYESKRGVDPLLGYSDGEECPLQKSAYIGNNDAKDPLISPIYADFTGFPPTLLHVGSNEMLESDSDIIAQRMHDAGVKIEYKKWGGMFHIFQMFWQIIPESLQAMHEIHAYVQSHKTSSQE